MESIGLMPSDTGEPGGKRTGQRMSDYPIEGGAFYLQCIVFAKMGYKLPFYDRYAKRESTQIRNISEPATFINSGAMLQAGELPAVEIAMIDNEPPTSSDIPTAVTGSDEADDSVAVASLLRPLSEQFDIDAAKLCQQHEKEVNAKRKTVYRCQSCGDRAWGKPSLDLWCGKCQIPFVKMDESYTKVESEDLAD